MKNPGGKTLTQNENQSQKILSHTHSTLDYTPEINLFAFRLNAQLERYASYRPDPHAVVVDAFSLIWGQEEFYAFSPFLFYPQSTTENSQGQGKRNNCYTGLGNSAMACSGSQDAGRHS